MGTKPVIIRDSMVIGDTPSGSGGGGGSTIDPTPTQGSTNAVSSDGVYTALQGKQNTLTFDTVPTDNSTNPVTSDGIYAALSGKQNTLTFDTTPTENSTNPVTSGGVYDAIQSGGGGGGDVSSADLREAVAESVGHTMRAAGYMGVDVVPRYLDEYDSPSTISMTNDLGRFSDNWSGSDFWTWINQEYIIGDGTLNNNGKSDFIKVGDMININCGTHGNYYVYVIGISNYLGTWYDSLSEGNSRTIDFMFARAWDVNRYYSNVNISHGGGYLNNIVKYDYWTSSDLYAYCNSLSVDGEKVLGNPNAPALSDSRYYTTDGVFYNLPSELKSVITPKYLTVAKRYTDNTNLVSNDNGTVEINVGKIWLPTEVELKGTKIYGSSYSACGSKQYEYFKHNNFIPTWLLTSPDGQHENQCYSDTNGVTSVAASTAKPFRPCFSVAITNY